MERKQKIVLIILIGAVYSFFMIGYTIGLKRENKNLMAICSEHLQIDIDEIKSVKYKGNSLLINLKSMDSKVSIDDRTIYDKFDPELVLNLKDAVKKENISIY